MNNIIKTDISKFKASVFTFALCCVSSFNNMHADNKTLFNKLSQRDKRVLKITKSTATYLSAKNSKEAARILKQARTNYTKKQLSRKTALKATLNQITAPQPLKNFAAQCYFNAMYQCLVQIPQLQQELNKQFGKNPYEKVKRFTINKFFAAGLAGMGQQDPEEALNYIFTKIKAATTYTLRNKITDTCSKCKRPKEPRKELFTHLQLPMKDPKKDRRKYPLQTLIRNYYQNEKTTIKCAYCSPTLDVPFNRSTIAESSPNIFITYLNRVLFNPAVYAQQLKLGKNNNTAYTLATRKIETPTPFVLQNLTFGGKTYQLVGCCMQSGNAKGGHYISFVCNKNQWYLCNDSSIQKISPMAMLNIAKKGFYQSFQPVLFFYKQTVQRNTTKTKAAIRRKKTRRTKAKTTHKKAKPVTPKAAPKTTVKTPKTNPSTKTTASTSTTAPTTTTTPTSTPTSTTPATPTPPSSPTTKPSTTTTPTTSTPFTTTSTAPITPPQDKDLS